MAGSNLRRALPAGIPLALLAAAAVGAAPFAVRQAPPEGAVLVGSAACAECHADIAEFYARTPHAVARDVVAPGTGAGLCEACHGPGSRHVEAGGEGPLLGKAALDGLSPAERAGMCLQCHAGLQGGWEQGDHAGTDASCADCHADQAHFARGTRGPAAFRVPGEFCLQCHPAQVAEFRLQHRHPVLEGDMACTECHAVHGEVAGVAALNDESRPCLRCHAEVAGPFVFEHEAAASEPCVECHRPHGSQHPRLLTQDDNSLCLRCHYEPGYPRLGQVDHAQFLARRARCWDCHREVHGSNVDATFRQP